jgi:hypothetical protein
LQYRKSVFFSFIKISWISNSDPDKNPDPSATARFQAISKAYKVLGDPKLRSTYDLLGPQGKT